MDSETIRILLDVVTRLDCLGIPYVIGGSIASSTHGGFRASASADILVELPQDRVKRLVGSFESDYYVSETAAAEAVMRDIAQTEGLCDLLERALREGGLDSMYPPSRDDARRSSDALARAPVRRRRPPRTRRTGGRTPSGGGDGNRAGRARPRD